MANRPSMTAAANAPALVRLSQLARFWELHPRTLQQFIQQGRLTAIRSPGNHFRVRAADVRAFCEREGFAVPPFVSPPPPPPARVVVATPSAALRRAVSRALRGAVAVEGVTDPYDALVRAARGPVAVLALDVTTPGFDAVLAVRALKRTPAGADITVVAFSVEERTAAALIRAGVARTLAPDDNSELPRVLRALLVLEGGAKTAETDAPDER